MYAICYALIWVFPGQGTNQGVCKNGLYLVQYCPILYYYILILLQPKYAATKNSKCRKGSADDCVAWRLNRFFCGILSPSFWQQEKHVHFGSHFGARHPHSLGTRCCGWSATFPELRLEMKMTNLGVSTLQHTAVGAGSFQGDSIIKLWSVTINLPPAGWRESVIWKTVRIHCLAMSLGRKWNDGTRDTCCFNDTFHASFASAK